MPRPKLLIVLALGTACVSSSALANGRFPNAQQLRALDERTLVVAGTYGILVTTNGGVDFAYQCESEIFGKPTGTYTVDPLLEVGPRGEIYSGSLHGLRVSRDRACTFETEPSLPRNWEFFEFERPAGAESGRIVDVCRRGSREGAPVLALVAMVDDSLRTFEFRLYETDAQGAFSVVGAPIPVAELDYGLTLEVAPSDPDRIYVSGTLANDPVLLASEDGGNDFRSSPLDLADADFVIGAYLGAVAPDDPERVYVRVARRVQTDDGLYVRDDSLAVSRDGGRSVVEVLRAPANLLGFALSPDGAVVLAGYGDPRVDETLSDPAAVGMYRGNAAELAFEHVIPNMDVSCIRFTTEGLYVCALERDPLGVEPGLTSDFHLGFHPGTGVPASAGEFRALLDARHVRGPAPWADGRTTACQAEWTDGDPAAPVAVGTCTRLNACEDETKLSPGALVCGETAGAGGSGGGAAGGRGATAGDGTNGGGGAGSSGAANRADEPGCGCRFGQTEPKNALAWAFAVALALRVRRARREPRARAS